METTRKTDCKKFKKRKKFDFNKKDVSYSNRILFTFSENRNLKYIETVFHSYVYLKIVKKVKSRTIIEEKLQLLTYLSLFIVRNLGKFLRNKKT